MENILSAIVFFRLNRDFRTWLTPQNGQKCEDNLNKQIRNDMRINSGPFVSQMRSAMRDDTH